MYCSFLSVPDVGGGGYRVFFRVDGVVGLGGDVTEIEEACADTVGRFPVVMAANAPPLCCLDLSLLFS